MRIMFKKKRIVSAMLLTLGMLVGCTKQATPVPSVAFEAPKELVTQGANNTVQSASVGIGIIQSEENEIYKNIYNGFFSGLDSDIKIYDYVVAKSNEDCMRAADDMVNAGCNAIFAIGEEAARAAQNRTPEIPVIVAGVENLQEKGFVKTNQTPGKNITGVSSKIRENVQVELLSNLFPKTKQVLVMHSTNVDSRIKVDEFVAACYGAGFKVIYEEVANADDIRKILTEYFKKENTKTGIDAMYCPMDAVIFSNMADTAGVCNDNKIPFFCNDKEMVTYGSFATAVAKEENMGVRAAKMIAKAIETPSGVANMSVEYVALDECKVIFNETTAELIEFEIPKEYKEQ